MGTRGHRSKFTALAYLAAGCLLAAAVPAEELRLEIITLEHSLAVDVAPLVQPFVGPGGSVTGMNDKLIVKAAEANLAEIKRVLAAVDRPPKRLKITVRQDVAGSSLLQEDAVSGRFRAGDVSGRLPDPGTHEGASVGLRDGNGNAVRYRAVNTRSNDDSRNTHFVTAMEGRPAFIQTGQSLPYPYQSARTGPYGVVVEEGVDYMNVNSGFYVTPRTHGDSVTLEIAPQLERAAPSGGGAIDTHYAETTVSGRLGEWIPLGGVNEDDSGGGTALLARTRRHDATTYNVWVRVEEMP